jgi:hypothetical protein
MSSSPSHRPSTRPARGQVGTRYLRTYLPSSWPRSHPVPSAVRSSIIQDPSCHRPSPAASLHGNQCSWGLTASLRGRLGPLGLGSKHWGTCFAANMESPKPAISAGVRAVAVSRPFRHGPWFPQPAPATHFSLTRLSRGILPWALIVTPCPQSRAHCLVQLPAALWTRSASSQNQLMLGISKP